MSQFNLETRLAISENLVSIPTSYLDNGFPYWVSNNKGVKIVKIKAMLGHVESYPKGGELVVTFYTRTSDRKIQVDYKPLTPDEVRAEWTEFATLSYKSKPFDVINGIDVVYGDFGVDSLDLSYTITEPSFIIGIVTSYGNIKGENLFTWIDYENIE